MNFLTQRSRLAFVGTAVALALAGCQNDDPAVGGTLENPPPPTSANFELVWADEFDGTSLNLNNWEIQLGDGTSEGLPPGWGNNEQQFYTADNITVEDGFLVIEARAGDSPDPNFGFTSGRIRTQGLFDFTYGRVEASIQVPEGLGLWAAFWTLGSDPSPFGLWAARGEIDIMESFGQATNFLQGTVHFGQRFPLNENVSRINDEIDPTDGFHEYAIEWDSQQIRWFVDGENYFTVTRNTYWNYFYQDNTEGFVSGAEDAPFNADQHILLNLAVGGDPAGTPNPNDVDVFPGRMLVDYVRVYQCPLAPVENGLGCQDSIDPFNPFLIDPNNDAFVGPQDVAISSFDLYSDGTGTLFEGSNGERPLGIGVFDNSGALTFAEVEAADPEYGMVLDIVTTGGGNIQINDPTGETFELFGMGRADDDLFFGGELEFDVFVYAEETEATALQVAVDSGFPNVGFLQVPLDTLQMNQWNKVSLSLSEVIQSNIGAFGGGPLNIEEVLNLIVFEPVGGAAHMQFDNVRLLCGAPESRPCGIVSVATVPQNVFIDDIDPLWDFGFGAVDSGTGFATYTDGTNPEGINKIEWEVVTDDDPARDQVLALTFNGDGNTGVFFIAGGPANLSGYNNGAVVFDLLVTDYGSDSNTMTMQIDCVFPCTSGPQNLGRAGDGEWQEIEIPLSQLIGGGLNTAMVSAGLIVTPTDANATTVFRIDNVRWEPTTDVEVMEAPPIAFTADFESTDASGGALGNNWLSFGTAFTADGQFVFNYGPFGTPLNDNAFANIAVGQGDAAQGEQQLVLFNDYNNAEHGNGLFIEAATFQQFDVTENDSGTYTFRFDARAPDTDAIAPPTTAFAYVQTLDPANGFVTTARVELDLSDLTSTEWQTFELSFDIDGATMAGQLLEFGFSNRTTDFAPSAILFDNIDFNLAASGISFTSDFEAGDANGAEIGDGWTSFGAAFSNADGAFAYGYGPFPTPNNAGGFAGYASGEGTEAQGEQYLNVFSDYNNADHGNGFTIEARNFQERTFMASDAGTYRFSFDAKAPFEGGIAPPTTALAFILTLDPNAGFATTAVAEVDMTNVSNTDWARFSVELALDESFAGQILQFGFASRATNFDPSGIFYDNVVFERVE